MARYPVTLLLLLTLLPSCLQCFESVLKIFYKCVPFFMFPQFLDMADYKIAHPFHDSLGEGE